MRIYETTEQQADRLTTFFVEKLLPVQLRHGARLVGRWRSDDVRVVALWEYDSIQHYGAVQACVAADPDSIAAQEWRKTQPAFYDFVDEFMLVSDPGPASRTAL